MNCDIAIGIVLMLESVDLSISRRLTASPPHAPHVASCRLMVGPALSTDIIKLIHYLAVNAGLEHTFPGVKRDF